MAGRTKKDKEPPKPRMIGSVEHGLEPVRRELRRERSPSELINEGLLALYLADAKTRATITTWRVKFADKKTPLGERLKLYEQLKRFREAELRDQRKQMVKLAGELLDYRPGE